MTKVVTDEKADSKTKKAQRHKLFCDLMTKKKKLCFALKKFILFSCYNGAVAMDTYICIRLWLDFCSPDLEKYVGVHYTGTLWFYVILGKTVQTFRQECSPCLYDVIYVLLVKYSLSLDGYCSY